MSETDGSVHEEHLDIGSGIDLDAILDDDSKAGGVEEEGEILDEIIQENELLTERKGSVLPQKIHTIVSGFMSTPKIHSSTTDKMKNVLVPENANFLSSTKVNDSIYSLIPLRIKRENSEMIKVESAVNKSVIVQAQVMEKILELKQLLPVGQAGIIKTLIKPLADSVEILSFGKCKLNTLRRDAIVKSLNPEFRSLTSSTSPGEGMLFGSSLTDVLKEIETSNKMTARLSGSIRRSTGQAKHTAFHTSSNSFLGRGQAPPAKRKEMNDRFKRTYSHQHQQQYRTRTPSPKRPRMGAR